MNIKNINDPILINIFSIWPSSCFPNNFDNKTLKLSLFNIHIINLQMTQQTVWLDCDPGLDDAFAVVLAARHKRINLLGISTSAGNTSLKNTTRNALNLLFNVGRSDVKVIQGSNTLIKGQMDLAQHMHGSNGLGGVQIPFSPIKAIDENNFQAIYNIISSQKQLITWANTGSLTNFCHFLRQFPQAIKHLKQIVIMGGSTGRGNRTPAAQFNIYFDPHAFQQVLKLKKHVPLVMVPLDTTEKVLANDEVFEFFQRHKNIPLSLAFYKMLQSYQQMYTKAYGIKFPMIHDPTVIYYILEPTKFQTKKALIEVDTCKVSYGRTNVYYNNPKQPQKQIQTIDSVCLSLKDLDAFWQVTLDVFKSIFDEKKQQ